MISRSKNWAAGEDPLAFLWPGSPQAKTREGKSQKMYAEFRLFFITDGAVFPRYFFNGSEHGDGLKLFVFFIGYGGRFLSLV